MAEVLVTIGLIGVVAAMTLTPLIKKYRIYQLEIAFKRTTSIIDQALLSTVNDLGLQSIKDLNNICGKNVGASQENIQRWADCVIGKSNDGEFELISKNFISKFQVINTLDQMELIRKKLKVHDFAGKREQDYATAYGVSYSSAKYAKLNLLKDGSAISEIVFFHHSYGDGISFTFDTNGPYKGPNRYGYDIFLYNTGRWYKLCTNTISNEYNIRGCFDYAMKDENPDDNHKKYWESLSL